MIIIRSFVRNIINKTLGILGIKIVNNDWGPKGFISSFKKIKNLGFYPDLIIDVGAARGEWSLECSEIFSNSRYLLIDPLEENINFLTKLEKTRSFKFWSGALGSREGDINFYLHGDQSSIFESEYNEGTNLRTIKMKTLISLLNDFNIELTGNVLLKVDVQGYELEVLKGIEHKLKQIEFILLEVSFRKLYKNIPLAGELISFMNKEGFRSYDICTYAQRKKDGELAQSDILFARADSDVFIHEEWE